ncbi:diguanylate cyclase [Microbacterium sp. Bi128]|uniref:sensor domain-containing diguanylate cyclase n=1 Tax=Microbacterium sp. Bi128 TaxID=2821115 RepID=UPI001E0BAC2A|nr:diguanylate cyclase [Microbacterium sp. Bi128]CAH0272864.1 Response regulator PleD [Microbacterium sp. Bi128]
MTNRSPLNRDDAGPSPLPEIPAQLRAVLNGIPALVGYWDTGLRNRLANDAYCEWFGFAPQQLHGMHVRDVLGETVLEANLPHIEGALAGKRQQFDRTLVDAAGQSRFTEVTYTPDTQDGAVQGFFVLVTDITERVLADRRRQRDMDRYRALARSVPGVFVLLFDAELRYLIAEGQELETFGYRKEELEGQRIQDVLKGNLASELEPRYLAALAGREVSWSRQIGHRTYRLNAGPVYSDDEAAAGMVVAVDITERLQQQKIWEALHEIATEVARNAAPAAISERVAAIVRDLFNVDSAAVVRFTGASSAEIVAMAPTLPPTLSRRQIFSPSDEPALVRYRAEGGQAAEQMRAGGFQSAAAAPIRVRGSLWGAVSLTSKSRTGVTEAMMERLAQFAELVEIAIGNTEARTDLEQQATTDALSGLPNRRALERHLAEHVAQSRTRGTSLSAVVLDIDHFKRVNDTHGHLTGDVVLAEVAARLRAVARAEEIVARFGGEEFVWLLPETDGAEALRAAERARKAIASEPFGEVGFLTISAGVCEQSDAAAGSLLDCADRALYEAKNGGRNRTSRYGHASPAVQPAPAGPARSSPAQNGPAQNGQARDGADTLGA